MGKQTINHHIGRRLRLRRVMLGLTQGELAKEIGVASQQVQKYETGANAMNVLRLSQFAETLRVPVGYFFDEAAAAAKPTRGKKSDAASDRESLEIVKSFKRIKDGALRKRLADLLRLIAVKEGD